MLRGVVSRMRGDEPKAEKAVRMPAPGAPECFQVGAPTPSAAGA